MIKKAKCALFPNFAKRDLKIISAVKTDQNGTFDKCKVFSILSYFIK